MNDDRADSLAARIVAAGLDWIVPDWPVSSRVCALTTTRNGGVSTGPYATLNLGFTTSQRATGDTTAAIDENRRRVECFLPSPPVWLDQIHETKVAIVEDANTVRMRAQPPAADAAVTRERDVVLAVLTADCLPVLLAERLGRAIGIVHAGWRGLARGVVENAIAAMEVAPEDLVAWLGPAIGPTAFEVGADVLAAFVDADPHAATSFNAGLDGKWFADLYALAHRRLEVAGIGDIHGGGFCTYTDTARFFSYRRDRETGRMATLLWVSGDS
jgi:purine-nucleoside/S-methyl-5'-thioadenosine phosphorylase / adenosine deaminase